MKLSDEKKRRMIVAGGGVVCIFLLIAIAFQFKKETPAEAVQTASITETDESTISTINTIEEETETSADEQEAEAKSIISAEAESQAADTGDSDGTEQSIQPEVTKPAEPLEEVKKDPMQTPSGKKVAATTTAPTETVALTASDLSNAETSATAAATEAETAETEENHDGEIYIPGFGWVEDHGGGVSESYVEDMYENGNKIGSMD